MHYARKEIDVSAFVSDIVNPDLGLWYTTAVSALDVWLVLLVTVATSWTTTHFEILLSLIWLEFEVET